MQLLDGPDPIAAWFRGRPVGATGPITLTLEWSHHAGGRQPAVRERTITLRRAAETRPRIVTYASALVRESVRSGDETGEDGGRVLKPRDATRATCPLFVRIRNFPQPSGQERTRPQWVIHLVFRLQQAPRDSTGFRQSPLVSTWRAGPREQRVATLSAGRQGVAQRWAEPSTSRDAVRQPVGRSVTQWAAGTALAAMSAVHLCTRTVSYLAWPCPASASSHIAPLSSSQVTARS